MGRRSHVYSNVSLHSKMSTYSKMSIGRGWSGVTWRGWGAPQHWGGWRLVGRSVRFTVPRLSRGGSVSSLPARSLTTLTAGGWLGVGALWRTCPPCLGRIFWGGGREACLLFFHINSAHHVALNCWRLGGGGVGGSPPFLLVGLPLVGRPFHDDN